MPEVDEYRTKIEAFQERLDGSNGASADEIQALKERLGTVRDSLQRKQETIDNQKAEIAGLREKIAQLSEMLGQAVAVIEAQSQGGIREIVQSIDSEFVGLLVDDEADAAIGPEGSGGEQGDVSEGAQTEDVQTADAQSAGAQSEEEQSEDAASEEAQSEGPQSEDPQSQSSEWHPDNESPRALQRIMGRHRR